MKTAKELELSLLIKETHIQQYKFRMSKIQQNLNALKELIYYNHKIDGKISTTIVNQYVEEIERIISGY